MKITYSKQSNKFLSQHDSSLKDRMEEAIKQRKGFQKLAPVGNHTSKRYRIKIEHYRAIIVDNGESNFKVDTINTKTNMKKKKYGYF